MKSLADWKVARLILNVDIVNKVEVIIEASLIAAKGFYGGSGEVSEKRIDNKRRLVKTT